MLKCLLTDMVTPSILFIITLANTTRNPIITSSYIVTSDHYPICTNINVLPNPPPAPTTFTYRSINAVDYPTFINDLNSRLLIINPPSNLPTCSTYFATLCSLLDHYTSLLIKTNKSSRTASTPCTTTEILSLKTDDRHLERIYITYID